MNEINKNFLIVVICIFLLIFFYSLFCKYFYNKKEELSYFDYSWHKNIPSSIKKKETNLFDLEEDFQQESNISEEDEIVRRVLFHINEKKKNNILDHLAKDSMQGMIKGFVMASIMTNTIEGGVTGAVIFGIISPIINYDDYLIKNEL